MLRLPSISAATEVKFSATMTVFVDGHAKSVCIGVSGSRDGSFCFVWKLSIGRKFWCCKLLSFYREAMQDFEANDEI